MPLAAIDDAYVRSHIIGQVEAVEEKADGLFEVRIALAVATVGKDAGQLINMLFGNTSIHDDTILHDVELPRHLVTAFGGPRHGLHELRRRAGAPSRAMTCSALKPQGLSAEKLADLARRLAAGGIDYIKDDHGLADQVYSPFAARVEAIAAALRAADRPNAHPARYVPSLSGDLDAMRAQIAAARRAGIDAVMVAPMIMGFANFSTLVRESPDIAFFAHPSMAGAARIAPAAADRKALPHAGRGRRRVSQPRRPFRLFARYLPAPRPGRLARLGRIAPLRAGAGRRHDAGSGFPKCLISMAPIACC